MTSAFPEASFHKKVCTRLEWTGFSVLPKMFGLLPRKWNWNITPAFSYDTPCILWTGLGSNLSRGTRCGYEVLRM